MRRLRALIALAVLAISPVAHAATPLLLYKITSPSSGAVSSLVDTSTGTALNLTCTSVTGTSIAAGVGATFTSSSGALSGSLSSTKVATALAGVTKATIEVVVDTTSATNFNTIFGVMSNAFDELFTVATGGATAQVLVTAPGGTSVAFDCPVGLHHLMAILDTTQASSANRVLLEVDGTLASVNGTPTPATYPALNAAIDVGFTNWANNRIGAGCLTAAGTNALAGPLYAAILYSSALTPGDASSHSTALLANNDADPNSAGTPASDAFLFAETYWDLPSCATAGARVAWFPRLGGPLGCSL